MSFKVTRNGEPVSSDWYTWDERTNTFCTNENNLDLDFTNHNGTLFKTGDHCTFKTWRNCMFDTGNHCMFDTSSHCMFNTASFCQFKRGRNCTFVVGMECKFDVGSDCVVIHRDTMRVIRLNNAENHYDMSQKLVQFEDIAIFKNGKDLEFCIDSTETKLSKLKELLSDKDLYYRIEREIFDKFT